MNPLMSGLAIALAISMASNAALGYVWLGARDELAVAETDRDAARGAATACSDATDDLRVLADKRAKEAKVARAAAAAAALDHDQKADEILSTSATTPGNDCKSAQDRVKTWLEGRK